MAVRISDIARALGISEATVSLALNNKEVVSEKTRRRVHQAAEKMGYYPNAFAQGLAKKSSGMIGIVVPDITNPYYGALVKYCGERIREKKYNPIFAYSNDSRTLEEQVIEQFISERVEGVLIAPTNKERLREDYTKKLERYGIRYMFVTSYYHNVEAPYAMVNLESGSYQLIRYLLDMGHRDIYFLTSNPEMVPTATRISGYRRAFEEYGIPVSDEKFVECNAVTFDQALWMTEELVESGKNIDAIVALNDMMALGALRALLNRGIRIPEEISLAGYDDVIFSNVSAIPLTTVKQDIFRLGREAVDILIKMIEGKQGNDRFMIEPELVVRRSTGRKTRQ